MSTKTHHSRRAQGLVALVAVLVTTALSSASAQPVAEPSVRVFPRVSLFAPLSADPRWPRFTIGYTRYFDDSQFTHVGTAEAGASIAIVQKDNRRGSWRSVFRAGSFRSSISALPRTTW
ncbi:MAG: DUF1207 domain-containing protein [Deltaproteobacteria bacterium]